MVIAFEVQQANLSSLLQQYGATVGATFWCAGSAKGMLMSSSASDEGTKVTIPKETPTLNRHRQPTRNFMEEALLGMEHRDRPPRPRGPSPFERWKEFKGTDSTASVTFGCMSFITTVLLAVATVALAMRSNDLLDRQNDLILSSSLPAVSAALLPTENGAYSLTIENTGPKVNFRSIEPMTLVKFTFRKYNNDMENGYVALYDVFRAVEPNEAGTGTLSSVLSPTGVSSVVQEVCAAAKSADARIAECEFEASLIVRYQTNTDEVHRNHYRFEGEVSLQVAAGELQRQVDRWDDGPNDSSAFSINTNLPEGLTSFVKDYVTERADAPPPFGF